MLCCACLPTLLVCLLSPRSLQGLLPDKPAILLVGGGEGMGKLSATVDQLDSRLQGSAQVRGAAAAAVGTGSRLALAPCC
jgi:hypothetical protein